MDGNHSLVAHASVKHGHADAIRTRMADFHVITAEARKPETIVLPRIQEVLELLDMIARTFARQNHLDPDIKKMRRTAPTPRGSDAQVTFSKNFIFSI